jgi:hypothetical protein
LRIRQLAETKSRLGGAKTVTTVSAEALAKAEQLTHIVRVSTCDYFKIVIVCYCIIGALFFVL